MGKPLGLKLVLILFIASGLASCSTPPATGLGLIYGGQIYPEDLVLKGSPEFWTNYGLSVEHILFSSGTEADQALIAGQANVNVGSDSKTVALFNAIPDQALILATAQRGDRYSTIVRVDSPYQSWADLKGKTVGTRLGTGAEQVLLRFFELSPDLAWEDYQWVNIGVEEMSAALVSGQIEAFTAWEPTPAIAEAQGIGRVLMSYGEIALVPVSLHTTLDYAAAHRQELVRFLAGRLDMLDLINRDPAGAAAIAAAAASAQGVDVSAEAFLHIFRRVDFSLTFDESVLAALQDTAQFLFDQGKIDAIPQFRWDGSYLQEAEALRGR